MSKKEVLKLGKIVDKKLMGCSDAAIWDLDTTLLIFIRDTIAHFKEKSMGYPAAIHKKYDGDEEKSVTEWHEILQTIVDDIDYYLIPTQELLCQAEKDILEKELKRVVLDEREGIKIINVESSPEIDEVYDREQELYKEQRAALKEAFDLLSEWIEDLWW